MPPKPPKRWDRNRILRSVIGASAALVLLLALILRIFLTGDYPEPCVTGDLTIEGGGALGRGAALVTHDKSAQIVLGGYCTITLTPETRLRLKGHGLAESVYLEHGEIVCRIDSSVGSFSVKTDAGIVTVTGTEFCVSVTQAGTGPATTVSVTEGTVLVQFHGVVEMLRPGDKRTFGTRIP